MSLIVVEDLKHWYMRGTPFETQVLAGVSLEIHEGEMVALVGPTRAGKSTLVQYFNGLFVPSSPAHGRVVVQGVDTSKKGERLHLLRQKVGLVFQYPEQQLFESTVAADVAFGPKGLGLGREEVDARVRAALRGVGMNPDDFAGRSIFTLSGGEKRRAAIAGVLALRPSVMVLDDPTAGLDPRGREEVLAAIRSLHESEGMTVVFVSNALEEAASLAERIIVLSRGRVAAQGTARAVLSDARALRRAGIEPPETVKLAARLAAEGWPVPADVLTVEEAVHAIYQAWRARGKRGDGGWTSPGT